MTKLLRKDINAVYRKKYSLPGKIITKKLRVLENLAKLLKPGKSKIFLSDIRSSYTKAYLSITSYKRIKSSMEKLGYNALVNLNNRIYYDQIDYTNCYCGVINQKISHLENIAKLVKPGKSEIRRSYAKAYLSEPSSNKYFKSYMKRLGYTFQRDQNNRIFYDLIDYN